MAPLVGGGVPQTVHSRGRVRLESERMFYPRIHDGRLFIVYDTYIGNFQTTRLSI